MCPAKATINMFCSNGNSEGERKSTAGIIFFLLRVSHLPSVLRVHAMSQKQHQNFRNNSSISASPVEKDLSSTCSYKFIHCLLTRH